MFVDPLAPFSKITDELLFILRERYPQGLSASRSLSTTMTVPPRDQQVRVAYAVLRTPNDPSQGWKDLHITGDEKPVDKNIKNNSVLAFVLQDPQQEEESPNFEVEWPSLDEDPM